MKPLMMKRRDAATYLGVSVRAFSSIRKSAGIRQVKVPGIHAPMFLTSELERAVRKMEQAS